MLLCQEGSCLCLILKRCIEGGRVGAYLFPGHSDQLLFCVEVGGVLGIVRKSEKIKMGFNVSLLNSHPAVMNILHLQNAFLWFKKLQPLKWKMRQALNYSLNV